MFGLAQYKILFMTEILVAELLLFFRLEKQPRFWLRLGIGLFICYLSAFLYPVFEDFSYNGFSTSLMFCLLFLISFVVFRFLFKVSWSNAFFCCILSYTIQHLAYEVFSFIFSIFALPISNILYGDAGIDFSNISSTEIWIIFGYFDIYIMTYGIAYRFVSKRVSQNGGFRLENSKVFFLIVLILLVDILLNAVVVWIRNSYNVEHEYDVSVYLYDMIIYIYSILSCILVLYIQFNMMRLKNMEKEMENITQILYQAQKQYNANKENINLINIKCHDLKHQASKFMEKGIDKDTVEEIKNLISIYDSQIKTGNEVLDIILSEKGLACQAKGINLTCMADCKKLDYMREGDLYALFGNILDNAMEAVMDIKEAEKRCISINAREVKNYVSISVKNYYNGSLRFSSIGLPITTKENTDYHGFGMLSIKMIVEKYEGAVSVDCDDDIFMLSIMLPIQDKM